MKLRESLRHSSEFGAIHLRYRARSKSLVYEQKGGNQTAVDENGVSLDSYVHALYGFAVQQDAKKILMIGCGGGSLGTMLARAGRRVTVVDIDKDSFNLARRYFGLPRSIECVVADGLDFLRRTRKRFDVLIIDVFVGEKIPSQFLTTEFFKAAKKCLRIDGIVLMNVCLHKKTDRTADALAAGFAKVGGSVRVLDAPGAERNAVVLAGAVKNLRAPKLLLPPQVGADEIIEELSEMRFRRRRAVK